ncbi:peptidoglycan DD-metalloendopeptidase family protein [Mesobacillus zeae]|uniref:peptidoglycan DD-metalloendopeptidase family protein n=1 Tax=Mesobacillus zeae TaxID=1917180 RepID=UPI00300AEDC6
MLPLQRKSNKDKSLLRRYGEHKLKQQGRKAAKRIAKKGAKVAAKAVKVVAKKFVAVLAKVMAWIVGAVGIPAVLIGLCTIIALIVISLAWSYMLGTGEGLTGHDKEIHQYIVEQSNSTVNMNSKIERPYRVPVPLIAATIQLEAFEKNDDIKEIIRKMASALAPTFDYGEYDQWREKQVTVCEDGKCSVGKVQHTKNMVTKLNSVDYWNGSTQFKYTRHITKWNKKTKVTYKTIKVPSIEYVEKEEEQTTTKEKCEKVKNEKVCKTVTTTEIVKKKVPTVVMKDKKIKVKTITKTRQQYFTSEKTTTSDYTTLDAILNSFGLGIKDKSLIEANYLFMGGQMAYTEWLQTMGGGSFNGGDFFDGTIIPGGGVPPQYMPIYRSAEKKYGVDWYILAAIHFVETGFSTHPTMISSVGAVGHVQFMPATWVGWKYNIGGGVVPSTLDITSLAVIASGGGYGRDGNNDGKADPWNMDDAIHTAAYYLSRSNYKTDPRNAIWHYNHAEWYVNKVLANAEKFKNAATYEGGGDKPQLKPGSFMRPAVGPISSPFGYRWGSTHYGTDIASGGKSSVPIVASADGVVSRSYLSSSYGNVVFIKHKLNGQDYETVYAHMNNRAVAAGQNVKQGQFLGYMGSTGNSTGVHCHFEIHKPIWTINKAYAINPALLVEF